MSAEKTIRWLHILDVLAANRHGLTTNELHRRLTDGVAGAVQPVDLRTVQRDIQEMDSSGVVRFFNPESDGKSQRWALRDLGWGRVMTPLSASTLKLVLRHMKGLLPPTVLATLQAQEEQADRLLALGRATEPGIRPWEQKLRVIPGGHALQAPTLSDDVLRTVYEALASERKISASYRRPGTDTVSVREYSVLALIVRPPKYQLLVRTDRDPYLLNIHRIGRAELLDVATAWPDDFDLDGWLETGEADIALSTAERLVITTTHAMADHWQETPLGEGQAITKGANIAEVSVNLVITDALRRYLLGLGDQVIILAPLYLRAWLGEQARSLAEAYTSS